MYKTLHSVSTAITRKKPLTPLSSPKPTPQHPPPPPANGSGSSSHDNGGSYQHSPSESQKENTGELEPAEKDEEDPTVSTKLKRTLGVLDLIFYGIGCSVGAGIYSLVGIGAQTAGPAISVSFGLCGVACCFTSLSYAEFAARIPMAGSAYTFTYVSFGELAGWLVGWNLTLGYAVSAAAVARSWAVYVAGFVQGVVTATDDGGEGGRGGVLPTVVTLLDALLQWLVKAPVPTLGSRDAEAAEATTCCPLAALVIVLCTLVLISGAKESARFNTIMTILNLSVLTFVVVAGLLTGSVRWDNLGLTTFSDAEEDTATATATTSSYSASFFGTNGFDGVGRAAGLVFFSYLGFDMVSCLSEEVINPEKNMPIGIVGSLISSTVIYCTVSLAVVGMVPIALLGEDTPVVNCLLANACCTHAEQIDDVMTHGGGGDGVFDCLACDMAPSLSSSSSQLLLLVGSKIVSFGAIFGLTTATFACLMGQPRIFYSMAQDGLLFAIYGQIDNETGVPTAGTILTGITTAFVACFIDLESLANTISLGTLMVFTFVNAGIIVLRLTPNLLVYSASSSEQQFLEEEDDDNCDVCRAEEQDHDQRGGHHDHHHDTEHYHLVSNMGTDHEKSRLIKKKNAASDIPYHVHNTNRCPKHARHLLPDDGGLMTMKHLSKLKYLSSSSSSSSSSWIAEDGPTTTASIGSTKPYWFTFSFTIFTVLASTGLSHGWPIKVMILLLLSVLFSASVLFGLHHQQQLQQQAQQSSPVSSSFQCPWVPAVPLLGIFCNGYMMGSMPSSTWYVITVWLLLGLCFYFTYGIHHSKLQLAASRNSPTT